MARFPFLHLLRHGQFVRNLETGDGALTLLGRRQAQRTAKRFRDLRVGRVYSSDLQRSRETAKIIAAQLPGISVTALPMLREILPTGIPNRPVPLHKRRLGKQRIEQVIKRFFSSPPRSGDTVVVCHGNLIRAVLCRLLGTPLTKWYQLGTCHCGITTFQFEPSNQVRLHSFNDTGHLATRFVTTV